MARGLNLKFRLTSEKQVENARQLTVWLREKVPRTCEDCGTMFTGTRTKRFCDRCRAERQQLANIRYEQKRSIARKEARRRTRKEEA
jgi:hypothetical protein